MKTLKNIISIVIVITLFADFAQAQMSPYKFKQQFDIAFAKIVDGEHAEAIPALQKLHTNEPQHGQVAYLLAMCQIKTEGVTPQTIDLLQIASEKYSYSHQRGLVTDKSAPAKAWFYLANVLAENERSQQAITAYRNYMSCVPLAPIDHKRTVVHAIRELREKLDNPRSVMSSGIASSAL